MKLVIIEIIFFLFISSSSSQSSPYAIQYSDPCILGSPVWYSSLLPSSCIYLDGFLALWGEDFQDYGKVTCTSNGLLVTQCDDNQCTRNCNTNTITSESCLEDDFTYSCLSSDPLNDVPHVYYRHFVDYQKNCSGDSLLFKIASQACVFYDPNLYLGYPCVNGQVQNIMCTDSQCQYCNISIESNTQCDNDNDMYTCNDPEDDINANPPVSTTVIIIIVIVICVVVIAGIIIGIVVYCVNKKKNESFPSSDQQLNKKKDLSSSEQVDLSTSEVIKKKNKDIPPEQVNKKKNKDIPPSDQENKKKRRKKNRKLTRVRAMNLNQ